MYGFICLKKYFTVDGIVLYQDWLAIAGVYFTLNGVFDFLIYCYGRWFDIVKIVNVT